MSYPPFNLYNNSPHHACINTEFTKLLNVLRIPTKMFTFIIIVIILLHLLYCLTTRKQINQDHHQEQKKEKEITQRKNGKPCVMLRAGKHTHTLCPWLYRTVHVCFYIHMVCLSTRWAHFCLPKAKHINSQSLQKIIYLIRLNEIHP